MFQLRKRDIQDKALIIFDLLISDGNETPLGSLIILSEAVSMLLIIL